MLTPLGTFATAAYLLAFTMTMWLAFCIILGNPSSPLTGVEIHPDFITAMIVCFTHWYNEYIALVIIIYVDMGPNICFVFAVEDYTFLWPFVFCFVNPILLPVKSSRSYGSASCSTLHILSLITILCHYKISHAEQRLETTFYIPFSNNTICAPRNGFVFHYPIIVEVFIKAMKSFSDQSRGKQCSFIALLTMISFLVTMISLLDFCR